MEDEALGEYCRRMVSRVRHKQQLHLQFSEEEEEEERRRHRHRGAGGRRERRQVVAEEELRAERSLPVPDCTTAREGEQTSPYLMCQGPEVHAVPPQLISMLRIKTFKEEMRRAAEVELHDPAVCTVCEQEQAALALKTFIKKKKTQLQLQALTARLNTHLSRGDRACLDALCKMSKSPPMPLSGFGRNYLFEMCGSQQPRVALATAKERGVALATDEMRGYPDKNATGTHFARPRCPFSDR